MPISAYTSRTLANLRRVAVAAYLRHGSSPQAAWQAVRARLPHLRAPYWGEQISLNTGRRRSYACPLGRALGIAVNDFGQHAAAWPRTRASEEAAAFVRARVVAWLESEACALA